MSEKKGANTSIPTQKIHIIFCISASGRHTAAVCRYRSDRSTPWMRNSSAATTTKTAPLASTQRFVFMGSSACSASASDDVEVLESLRDVPVLRFLGVQLDVQPQVVHAVGVPQRVLVADLARLEQVEQRLIEGRSEERRVGKECRSRWSPY